MNPLSIQNRVLILICVHLRSSVYICGKNLTNDNNRQFDEIAHVLTMPPDMILLVNLE